jgi:hypothetical protein
VRPVGGSVASGGHDAAGAEPPRDLHGHRPRVAGGTQDEDRLTGRKPTRRRSATQDDIAGFIAAAIAATSTPAGSCTERLGSTSARSAIVPVTSSAATKYTSAPSDAVHAGHHRQGATARVVAAARARAHPRMEARREHLDDLLPVVPRDRGLELPVVRRPIEARHHRGVSVVIFRPPRICW